MKRVLIILTLLVKGFVPCDSKAQNLVSNGGFEQLNSCTLPSIINNATSWCDYSGYENLFNTCVPVISGLVGSIPRSYPNYYQYPRTGNGFGANVSYSNFGINNRRSYIQTQLTQSLIIKKKYFVKFYVNLNNESQYGVDKICALLTNTPIACNTGTFTTILATPQIVNKSGIITDTLNWIEVCDTMTAIGNEQYLIIGNFFSDANTNISLSYPSGSEYMAHYNIDDVSVEELILAKCKPDTSICANDSVDIGNNTIETATYNWQPSTGLSCGFCPNPKASPNVTTKYVLTKQNCNIITKDSVTITLKNNCNPNIEIPNVFTPNGDGVNDVWQVNLSHAQNVSLELYNRWGNVLTPALSKGEGVVPSLCFVRWDGRTTSGVEASEGVYYYVLEYTNSKGDKIKKNGYVSLFR